MRIEPLEVRSLLSGYTFTDLGTLGGPTSHADDINARGQIVGAATTTAGDEHAFLWHDGCTIDLGTFGGPASDSVAISNRGQVVGWAQTAAGYRRAFLVTPEDSDGDGMPDRWYRDSDSDGINDLMLDLGTFGGNESFAYDVNDLGQVVGWAATTTEGGHSFQWQNGSMTDLTTSGFSGAANAINDVGQIAGGTWDQAGNPLASLWQSGHATILGPGWAVDINNDGQVILNSAVDAYLWSPVTANGTTGTLTRLFVPPGGEVSTSQAYGLNNLGQVVAYWSHGSYDSDGGYFEEIQALWSNEGYTDLNASNPNPNYPETLYHAEAINEGGQVVGYGLGYHAYLLTPSHDQPRAPQASSFVTSGFPSPTTAGTAGTFTVTAKLADGTTATGYAGTVHFTSSDVQAVVPGDYTFTTADQGVHTFGAILKTAGMQSLTATDRTSGGVTGTQAGITVNPAAASRLLVSAPATAHAGTKFGLTVTVVDAYGNVVTGYRGRIAFRSSDSTAVLPRGYAFTSADQGVHTFSSLVLKKKGKQTITVTDTLDGSLTASVLIDVV
jgi:probable HAF family extracellular repeat protein